MIIKLYFEHEILDKKNIFKKSQKLKLYLVLLQVFE